MGQPITLLESFRQLDADAIETQFALYLLKQPGEEPDLVVAAKQLSLRTHTEGRLNLGQHGIGLFGRQRGEGELAEFTRLEHGIGHRVVLAQASDEEAFAVEDLRPDMQIAFLGAGLPGAREQIRQRVETQGIAELVQQ
ncbi:hypothetical protein D3C85_1356720 [compost metagenome]